MIPFAHALSLLLNLQMNLGPRRAPPRSYATHHPIEIARLPPWGVLGRA